MRGNMEVQRELDTFPELAVHGMFARCKAGYVPVGWKLRGDCADAGEVHTLALPNTF